jgi:NADH:ubiquinone oxidoreductase subunit 3 (subunit A)
MKTIFPYFALMAVLIQAVTAVAQEALFPTKMAQVTHSPYETSISSILNLDIQFILEYSINLDFIKILLDEELDKSNVLSIAPDKLHLIKYIVANCELTSLSKKHDYLSSVRGNESRSVFYECMDTQFEVIFIDMSEMSIREFYNVLKDFPFQVFKDTVYAIGIGNIKIITHYIVDENNDGVFDQFLGPKEDGYSYLIRFKVDKYFQ